MSELSLTELEKLQDKLLLWIKNDRNYLDDYKDFYYSEGEYYFHISFTGHSLSKNATVTKLNDLWDLQTKKPLNDKQKANIKAICDKIIKEEKRLREIQNQISTAILGDNFFEENIIRKRKNNERIEDNKRIDHYIKTAIKLNDIPRGSKYLDKTMYRKLNDKSFLTILFTAINKKKKYKTSLDKSEMLTELENYIILKINRITQKEQKTNKQLKTTEYNDNISNEKQRKFSDDY